MRSLPVGRRAHAHLVTQAQQPKSQDIANRERRYLIMMAIRLVCFLGAILMYAAGAGWYALIPAVGAIVIPYLAVVFANAGREPSSARGLAEFQPPHLPEQRSRELTAGRPHIVGYVTYGDAEHSPQSAGDATPPAAESAPADDPADRTSH